MRALPLQLHSIEGSTVVYVRVLMLSGGHIVSPRETLFYPSDAILARFAMGMCLSDCVSVTRRYCIKMVQPIDMLFAYSDSSYTMFRKIRSLQK